MKQLHISPALALPIGIANKTLCLFGKGGSGKSNLEVVLAEELYAAGIPTCIVDPADIHYGIKSAGDGKSAGLPFIVFGGLHADVPIYPENGALLADLFLDRGLYMVIVTQPWTGGERSRFMTDFANQLYKRGPEKEQRGSARVLMLEEAHEYVPLVPGKGEEVMLGAMKRLYTVGRNYWIGFIAATRRPAKMHTDLRNGADATAFFQIVGTQDRKAMTDYLGEMAEKDVRDEILSHLAKMPVGEAYFYQPNELPAVQRVKFRKRNTLDTTTTEITAGHKVIKPVLAAVDLEQLGDAMAAAREKAKADDPRELRKRIAELERQLKSQVMTRPVRMPAVEVREVIVEVPSVYDEASLKAAIQYASEIEQRAGDIGAIAKVLLGDNKEKSARLKGRAAQPTVGVGVNDRLERRTPDSLPALSTTVKARSVPSAESSNGHLHSRPQQKLLDALMRLESARVPMPTRTQAAALAGVSPKSSGFEKNVSTLSTAGLVTYPAPGRLQLTHEGRSRAAEVDAPPTVEEFQDYLCRLVSGPQAALLRALIVVYPQSRTREQLASLVDVSPLSSGFEKNVSTLSSFGFVAYPTRGSVAATPLVFLEDA